MEDEYDHSTSCVLLYTYSFTRRRCVFFLKKKLRADFFFPEGEGLFLLYLSVYLYYARSHALRTIGASAFAPAHGICTRFRYVECRQER